MVLLRRGVLLRKDGLVLSAMWRGRVWWVVVLKSALLPRCGPQRWGYLRRLRQPLCLCMAVGLRAGKLRMLFREMVMLL